MLGVGRGPHRSGTNLQNMTLGTSGSGIVTFRMWRMRGTTRSARSGSNDRFCRSRADPGRPKKTTALTLQVPAVTRSPTCRLAGSGGSDRVSSAYPSPPRDRTGLNGGHLE